MSAAPSAVQAEALRQHLELLVREAPRAFHAIQGQLTVVRRGEAWQWRPTGATG